MSVSRFLAGFVVGGAIGAIAGILLAPKSGEETRKIIADNAKEMARRADETAKQIPSEQLEHLIAIAKGLKNSH